MSRACKTNPPPHINNNTVSNCLHPLLHGTNEKTGSIIEREFGALKKTVPIFSHVRTGETKQKGKCLALLILIVLYS